MHERGIALLQDAESRVLCEACAKSGDLPDSFDIHRAFPWLMVVATSNFDFLRNGDDPW